MNTTCKTLALSLMMAAGATAHATAQDTKTVVPGTETKAVVPGTDTKVVVPGTTDKAMTEKTMTTPYYTESEKSDFRASKLMGARVYATNAALETGNPVDKVSPDWKDVGEINNIIIGKDGSVKAVVLGVGGFLGIGEKDVAVRMSELKFVKKSGDAPDQYFIVVKSDKESLEKAPTYVYPKS